MSSELGNSLPQDLHDFLSSSGPLENFSQVILFTTTDAGGWPRHGMLSSYEVVAKSATRILMLLYRTSHSTRNLRREGKVSLIVVNPAMSYYLRCSAQLLPSLPEAPEESLFNLEVEKVFEDSLPTAGILSGITFEGYDPGMTRENRELVLRKLQEMP